MTNFRVLFLFLHLLLFIKDKEQYSWMTYEENILVILVNTTHERKLNFANHPKSSPYTLSTTCNLVFNEIISELAFIILSSNLLWYSLLQSPQIYIYMYILWLYMQGFIIPYSIDLSFITLFPRNLLL